MRGLHVLALLVCVASACGGGSGDSASSTGTGTTDVGSTGGGSSTSTGAGSTGGSGTAGGSTTDGTTTGATDVTLFGVVDDRVTATPIPGAMIRVEGMPGFETVSDDEGLYVIDGLPPQTELFVVVEPSTDYFGSVVPVWTLGPGQQEQELAQISFAFVDNWKGTIEMMGSMTLDDQKASVLARVIQNTATGTTVDFQPAPVMDSYFAPDKDGNPVLNSNVAEFPLLPVVVFANLEPQAAGTYTVSASHPERECTVPHPSFPTFATHVTLVDVDCPPVLP